MGPLDVTDTSSPASTVCHRHEGEIATLEKSRIQLKRQQLSPLPQIEPYGLSGVNETLPDLAGWLVDGETGEGLHKTVSVNLHLIHGSSTLDRTTTFGHQLSGKKLSGNKAYYARVGSVRSSSPKYASHGLWKPSSAITAKAPTPSPSAWNECLMKFAF